MRESRRSSASVVGRGEGRREGREEERGGRAGSGAAGRPEESALERAECGGSREPADRAEERPLGSESCPERAEASASERGEVAGEAARGSTRAGLGAESLGAGSTVATRGVATLGGSAGSGSSRSRFEGSP
jgi:hypothetical protein